MANQNEYLLPLGISAEGFVAELRQLKASIVELQTIAKQSGAVISETFTVAGTGAAKMASETIKGTKAITDEGRAAKESATQFATVLDVLTKVATQQGKSFDATQLAKYSAAVKGATGSLTDFLTVSAKSFDPTKLAALDQQLQGVENEFQELNLIIDFVESNLRDLKLDPATEEGMRNSIGQLKQLFKEVDDAGKKAFLVPEEQVFEQKTQSAKQRLRELKNELASLDEGDPRFLKLTREAGLLTNKIRDIDENVRLVGSDTTKLDAAFQGLQGVVGIFAAMQGAAALFGDQNEELQKTLLKVNAAMSILQGLQQVGQILDEGSALNNQIRNLLKSKEIALTVAETGALATQTAVTEGATVAQTGLNAAMLANPVGIILLAIAALVAIFVTYKATIGKVTDEERRRESALLAMAEAQKKAADAIAKEEGQLNILVATSKDDRLNRTERQAAIDKIRASFPEYLGDLSLENLYTANSSELIEKQIVLIKQRALVRAAEDVYVEKLKKVAEAEAELNKIRDSGASYWEKTWAQVTNLGSAMIGTSAQENALKEATEDLNNVNTEAAGAFDVVNEARDKFSQGMQGDVEVFQKYINQFQLFNEAASKFKPTFVPFDKEKHEAEKKLAIDAAQAQLDIAVKGTDQEIAARKNLLLVQHQFEVADKRKTDEELKLEAAKFQGELASIDNEFRARSLKDATAFAQYKILIAKQGTKEELAAQLKAIDVATKESLAALGLGEGERLRIIADAEKKKDDLRRQFSVKQLQDEISVQQAILNQSIEGSQESFVAKKKVLELQASIELVNAKNNSDKILEIYTKLDHDIAELTKTTNAAIVETGLNAEVSRINEELATVQKGTEDELTLRKFLIDQQAALESNSAQNSINDAHERQAKLIEILAKANAEKLALDNDFFQKRIAAEMLFQNTLLLLENERLNSDANKPGVTAQKKFDLEKQIRENELQAILNEDNEIEKQRQKGLLSDEEYAQKKLDILTKFTEKRDANIAADLKKPQFNLQNSILKLFGIDLSDPNQAAAIKAIGDVWSEITNAALDNAQKQIDAIQTVIDATQSEIDAQQKVVDIEKENSDKGLANNLGNQQAALDDLKKKKAEEIKEREDAQKKLEEIHKRQAVIQAASILATNIQTGVNMIEALSEIFKANAGIPIAGVILAAGFAALMLSTFLSIKAAFQKASADVPTIHRKGGGEDLRGQLLKGPSHENKGIGLYDNRTGREIAQFEGDEYLYSINRQSTKKYLPILEQINNNIFPVFNRKEFKTVVIEQGRFNMERAHEIIIIQREAETKKIDAEKSNRDELLKLKAEVVSLHKTIRQHHDGSIERTDYGDYILEKENGRTRKIFKRKI